MAIAVSHLLHGQTGRATSPRKTRGPYPGLTPGANIVSPLWGFDFPHYRLLAWRLCRGSNHRVCCGPKQRAAKTAATGSKAIVRLPVARAHPGGHQIVWAADLVFVFPSPVARQSVSSRPLE